MRPKIPPRLRTQTALSPCEGRGVNVKKSFLHFRGIVFFRFFYKYIAEIVPVKIIKTMKRMPKLILIDKQVNLFCCCVERIKNVYCGRRVRFRALECPFVGANLPAYESPRVP